MTRASLVLALSLAAAAAVAAPWSSHGPTGGIVTQFAVAPVNHNVIYVIAPDGVFRTGDAGATWSDVTGPISLPAGLAVSNAGNDTVVVAAANGMFRTDDGGLNWRGATGLPPAATPRKLVADPHDPNVLYLSVGNCFQSLSSAGIYKSTDGGRSFTTLTEGLGSYERCLTSLIVDPLEPERLYSTWAYQDISGSSRSDDGGLHWTAVNGRSPQQGVVVGTPVSQVRYGIGDSGFTLLASTDGVNWSSLVAFGIEDGKALAARFNTLALDPITGRIFLGSNDGAYRSGNGGTAWLRLGGAALDAINAIDYDFTNSSVLIGTDFGLFRSTGLPWNEWQDLHLGNAAVSVGQVVADPSNGDVYARSARHLFVSHDLGQSWETAGDPLVNPISTVVIDAGHRLYAIDYRNGLYYLQRLSADGHWEQLRTTTSSQGLVTDPIEPGKLYSLDLQALGLTRDGGATWERLPLPSTALALSIDPRHTDSMLASTFDGLYQSADGGRTWTIDSTQTVFLWIVRAPSNPDVLYANGGSQGFIMRSTDGGRSWSTMPQRPAGSDGIGALVVDPRDSDTIYVPTFNHGIFRSTDAGRTWQSVDEGLPENHGASLAFDSKGAFLHAGTTNRGVWELPLTPSRRRAAAK